MKFLLYFNLYFLDEEWPCPSLHKLSGNMYSPFINCLVTSFAHFCPWVTFFSKVITSRILSLCISTVLQVIIPVCLLSLNFAYRTPHYTEVVNFDGIKYFPSCCTALHFCFLKRSSIYHYFLRIHSVFVYICEFDLFGIYSDKHGVMTEVSRILWLTNQYYFNP